MTTPTRLSTTVLTLIWILGLFMSCAAPEVKPEDPTKPIQSQWDRFVTLWESENAAELAAFYTEEGINVPPGFEVNEGRQTIENFYKMLFDNNLSSTYQHEIQSLEFQGDFAVEYGNFHVDWVRNDGTEWRFSGRSVTHWVLEADSTWRIALFLFNNPPAADE